MGTTRRLLAGLATALLLAPALVSCSDDDVSVGPTPDEIQVLQQQLLDVRDKAIRSHDQRLFMSTVARGDKAFVRRQRAWFANVNKLPWEVFRTKATRSDWPNMLLSPAWGEDASIPRLQVTSQLGSFDEAPVVRTSGLAFGWRHGVLKVVGDRTANGDFFPGYQPTPWDLVPLTVRTQTSVLGLFDAETAADADRVMDAVIDGVHEVAHSLPFSWDGPVVVYAFGSRRVLNSFDNVPGGKIQHLGAMTFPVRSREGARKVVGLRFTLLPSSIDAGQPFLGRIVRHELTHVALGHRDDAAPLWLSEGLAEYIGARGVPGDQRRIAAVAVDRARSGGEVRLPAAATFNGPEQDWHYALSWMACDYIADSLGEARLWDLLDAFSQLDSNNPEEHQDQVLTRVLGFNSTVLATRARDRIRTIYD